MSKLVYVSGKISGLEESVWRTKFQVASRVLREAGYAVISPEELEDPDDRDYEWHEYLRRDIRVLAECKGIALLDNWHTSRGAHLELLVAKRLGMFVLDAQTLEDITDKVQLDYNFIFSGMRIDAIDN